MATAQTAKSSNGKTAPVGKVVDDGKDQAPSIADQAIAGAADGFAAFKKAATSDTAKELGKTAATGMAWGLGLGCGVLLADHLFN